VRPSGATQAASGAGPSGATQADPVAGPSGATQTASGARPSGATQAASAAGPYVATQAALAAGPSGTTQAALAAGPSGATQAAPVARPSGLTARTAGQAHGAEEPRRNQRVFAVRAGQPLAAGSRRPAAEPATGARKRRRVTAGRPHGLRNEAYDSGTVDDDECYSSPFSGPRSSVPDPDPPGSEIIWPQGSGSEIINFGSGSGSFPFSHQA